MNVRLTLPVIRIEKQTWGLVELAERYGEDGMKKSDQYSRKMAGLMELAERYGVKVKESSVGSIGFVGVRRQNPWTTIIPVVVRNRRLIEGVAGQEDCKRCRAKMVARVRLLG